MLFHGILLPSELYSRIFFYCSMKYLMHIRTELSLFVLKFAYSKMILFKMATLAYLKHICCEGNAKRMKGG